MKYTDLKEGDSIVILTKPKYWSSHYTENNPLDEVTFPFTGVITKIDMKEEAAEIGGYGWALDYLTFKMTNSYEIY